MLKRMKNLNLNSRMFFFSSASEDQSQSEHNTQRLEPGEFADARIDIRKFAQFLMGQQVNPLKVICSEYDVNMTQNFLLFYAPLIPPSCPAKSHFLGLLCL